MGLHGKMWDLDGRPFMDRRGRRAQGAFLWEEWPNCDPDMGECRAGLRNRSCPQGCGGGCGKGGIQTRLGRRTEPESDVPGGLGKYQMIR